LSGIFGEDFGEGGCEQGSVGFGEQERRAEFDDVVVRAVGTGEDAAVSESIDDVGGLRGGGGARFAIGDEVDAEEETGAADVADEGMVGLQSAKRIEPARADFEGVFLKIFFTQDLEDREAGGTGDGIAAECAEKFHAVVEGSGDFSSGDDGGERKSIADGFAEDDDVGNNLLRFETPEMRAEAAEADLDFVRDADTTRRAHVFVDFG